MKGHAQDLFRRFIRNLFDIHAAGGRSHEKNAGRSSIDQGREIEFTLKGADFLDQYGLYGQAFWPRLVGDEMRPEHRLCMDFDGLKIFSKLDAPSFTAAAAMDLCLDDPAVSAEGLSNL